MYLRIWRTEFDPERQTELQHFAEQTSAPMFRSLPGCLGYVYAVADQTWITQTFWESEAHIASAEASAHYRDVVAEILAIGVLAGNQSSEVFEVTAHQLPDG